MSLDGKANRLAAMIRGNLGAAMQGLAVVPLFAGFDLDAAAGHRARPDLQLRRHRRELRGARLRRRRLRLAVRQELAEEDLAQRPAGRRRHPHRRRGALRRRRRRLRHRRPRPGPPALPDRLPRRRRGRRPAHRRRGRRRRRHDRHRAGRGRPPEHAPGGLSHDHAVLRLSRAAHARPLGVRPQGHLPRPQRRRPHLRRRRPVHRREPQLDAAQGRRALRPHRLRRRRPVQRVREPAGRRRPPGRRPRLLLQPPRRHRPGHRQRLRPDPRRDLHPADEALRGRALRRRGRRPPRERPAVPAHLRRLDRRRARLRGHGRAGRGRHRPPARALPRRHGPVRRARGRRPGAVRGQPGHRRRRQRRARRSSPPPSSRSPSSTGAVPSGPSAAITGSALRTLLGDEATPDARRTPRRRAHAPSVSEPGTPPGLGDPANPDTAGGTDADAED